MPELVDLGLGLLLVAAAVLIVVCTIKITKSLLSKDESDK